MAEQAEQAEQAEHSGAKDTSPVCPCGVISTFYIKELL